MRTPPRVTGDRLIHPGSKYDYHELSFVSASGREQTRPYVKHPGAVCIVPVLPDSSVVLIRVYRVTVRAWQYECCAGTIERNDPPADTARRELIEETGYRAGELIELGWFYTSPGLSDEKMHVFGARGLEHVGQDLEEDEFIEVERVEPERVWAMIDSGELHDAKSIASLLLAHRHGLVPMRPAPAR